MFQLQSHSLVAVGGTRFHAAILATARDVSLLATAVLAATCLIALLTPSNALARPDHGGEAIAAAGTIALTSTIPDPSNCTVTPCDALNGIVLVPDLPVVAPVTLVTVVVRNDLNDPMESAAVRCDFRSDNALCSSAEISGTTDVNGRVELRLFGGGCVSESLAGLITANGVAIRAYAFVKSPDFDGAGSDGRVNVADLVVFSNEFLGTSPPGCHDYDNNSVTDLGDLVILAPAFSEGSHCP